VLIIIVLFVINLSYKSYKMNKCKSNARQINSNLEAFICIYIYEPNPCIAGSLS